MRKVGAVLLLVILFACTAFSQQAAAPASDQATTADVLQMFKEMHFEEQITNIQTAITRQMDTTFQNMMNNEQFYKLPPEKQARLRAFLNKTMEDSVNVYPVKELIADFAPMYAKYLTKSDIQTITAFYHTPTGQKLLAKSPEITRDAMAVISPKMQQRMEDYMQQAQKQVAEIMEEPAPDKSDAEKPKN